MEKTKLKNLLKCGILLFGISLLIVACQKDDDLPKQELVDDNAVDEINIKTIVGKQIPKNITNFLKDKTDNTLQFSIANKKIQPLNQQIIASRGADLEIGTVDTSKSAMVVNETNTKYTFEMVNSDVTSKHNLIVIDLGTDIVNYYISYKPETSWLTTHDITKDMRFFTGDIIFYNTDGVESSVLKIVNGSVDPNTSKVISDPCDEVEEDEEEEEPDDDTTNDNNTGSTGGSSGTGNGGPGSNPANGSGGGSGTNTEQPFADMCEYTIGMTCSGTDQHTSDAGCIPQDSWSITFNMPCGSFGLRTSGDPISPCVGDVGIIINPEIHENNCEDLHKFSTNPYSQNEFLSQESDVSDTKEKGYILTHVPFNPGFNAQPIEAEGDCKEIGFPINGSCYGYMHTHPTGCEGGTHPMFFEGDIHTMYKMSQTYNATSPVDNSIFSAYMTVDGNHYAMKIKDITKFNEIGTIYNDRQKKRDFIRSFERTYERASNNCEPTQNELAEAFLNFINKTYDLGISVYRSSHDDVNYDPNLPLDQQNSNWTELILDENNNLDYNDC